MSKRSHKTTTLRDKHRIIQCLDSGDTLRGVAKKFGISPSTVCDIKKQRARIIEFITERPCGMNQRTNMRPAKYPGLEKLLYSWYLERKGKNEQVSSRMLMMKAREIKVGVDGQEMEFSEGWLNRFKARYGIVRKNRSPELNLEVLEEVLQSNTDKEENQHQSSESEEEITNIKIEIEEEVNPLQNHQEESPVEEESHDDNEKEDVKYSPATESNVIDDESYEHFAKYVNSLLKKLPKHKSLALQPKIIELITNEIINNE